MRPMESTFQTGRWMRWKAKIVIAMNFQFKDFNLKFFVSINFKSVFIYA